MSQKIEFSSAPAAEEAAPSWLPLVVESVKSLDFGTVQIVVHNSRVVQVERLERHRFDAPQSDTKKVEK